MLCRWEELPDFMRTEEVWPYYEVLSRRRFSLILKRIFDFIVSTALIVLLIPLFIVLAAWIRLDSEGPVLYRQVRITQYGRRFRIYKFRTMIQNADYIGSLVTAEGDRRVTMAGMKLRGSRLDELPQLINIWKGEMTFVGTRPEVPKYVESYTKEMLATLLLPAGVTSQASVQYKDEDRMLREQTEQGRNIDQVYTEEILPEKMKWNLMAIKKFSLRSEFVLSVKTIMAVSRAG